MSMGLRIGSICIAILLSIQCYGQELVYNAFIQDSVGVGENAYFYITIDESALKSVESIDLSGLEEIKFFSAAANPTDSIVAKKADISINSLGIWNDENKDGVISGEELKWERVENNGEVIHRNKINISFFDVGIYIIEGLEYSIGSSTSKTNRALMKATFIDYQLEVVDSTGLAPIKDIERTGLSVIDLLPLLFYLVIPAILIFIAYRYWRKKKNIEAEAFIEPEVVIPPDVKALTELKGLRGKELWQKGEIKQYQSELSHIIREYLEGRYSIRALENTTREIVRSIKDKSFTEEDQQKLIRILQISDLVKFAKAKPDVSIHETFMNDAIAFVQSTRKSIELNQEEE
jgi:hypothetical protein